MPWRRCTTQSPSAMSLQRLLGRDLARAGPSRPRAWRKLRPLRQTRRRSGFSNEQGMLKKWHSSRGSCGAQVLQQPRVGGVGRAAGSPGRGLAAQLFQVGAVQRRRSSSARTRISGGRGRVGAEVDEVDAPAACRRGRRRWPRPRAFRRWLPATASRMRRKFSSSLRCSSSIFCRFRASSRQPGSSSVR